MFVFENSIQEQITIRSNDALLITVVTICLCLNKETSPAQQSQLSDDKCSQIIDEDQIKLITRCQSL